MVARKPDDERQRRNAHIYQKRQLTWDGLTRGPSLPEEFSWCDSTQRFWEDFRNSANAMIAQDSDWESLLVVALLHNRLWSGTYRTGSEMTSITSEIRRRLAPYGYTYEDRLRFNIEISESDASMEEQVKADAAAVVDYFSMLNAEVAKNKGSSDG